ncbi:MAG: 5'-nucleotidase [Rhodothermales bacterium]|jgi:5'-nucleotidase
MTKRRPLILISNDDGIDAPGIHALAAAMVPLGDVHVVAPLMEQSAVGHAITLRDPVRAHPWPFRGPHGKITAHAVTGTPADCVKLAIDKLLPRRPDLVVSGINQGPNAAVNVIYSGTVSAATEASILGIDAVAISYCRWNGGDFGPSAVVAQRIAKQTLQRGLPPGILLNVNVPDLSLADMKGVLVTRQARSRWEEAYSERLDPFERPYYWMAGTFVNLDEGENTDLQALEGGHVSVTPIQHDLTAHDWLDELGTWTLESEVSTES